MGFLHLEGTQHFSHVSFIEKEVVGDPSIDHEYESESLLLDGAVILSNVFLTSARAGFLVRREGMIHPSGEEPAAIGILCSQVFCSYINPN